MSAVTSDNLLLVGYGDYDANTGPVSVLAFDPETGLGTTLLADVNTEALRHYRKFDDGSIWAPSIDPRGSALAFLVTNRGGTWRTITVDIPSLTVAVHLHDVAETSDGTLYVCGSRDILPSESDTRPSDEGAAIVWCSNDGGSTWVENLVYFGDYDNQYNRFRGFGRVGDRLVVSTHPGVIAGPQGYYVLNDGIWSERKTGHTWAQRDDVVPWGDGCFYVNSPLRRMTLDDSDNLNAEAIDGLQALLADGDRLVYSTADGLIDTVHGDLGAPTATSVAETSDGTLYVSDGARIFRVVP